MAAANNEFFEALSMLEHERGITAEYLIEKIKAAIVIAVKKNYEVEDDHVMVEIDPNTGKFNVALIQDVVADEDWYDEHSEIGITEAQHIRKSYQVGDRVVTPLKTKDFGRIAAQTRISPPEMVIRFPFTRASAICWRACSYILATVDLEILILSAHCFWDSSS